MSDILFSYKLGMSLIYLIGMVIAFIYVLKKDIEIGVSLTWGDALDAWLITFLWPLFLIFGSFFLFGALMCDLYKWLYLKFGGVE